MSFEGQWCEDSRVQIINNRLMSFKSIIVDVRGEIDSISRNSLWSRSSRAVHDNSVTTESTMEDGASKQSCWEQLPPELLRDVLIKIEEDETWPTRKNVVACAGVCKTWRATTREIVRTPEISKKITFPISMKQVCAHFSYLSQLFFAWVFWTLWIFFFFYYSRVSKRI